jgi:hypothetical protein
MHGPIVVRAGTGPFVCHAPVNAWLRCANGNIQGNSSLVMSNSMVVRECVSACVDV